MMAHLQQRQFRHFLHVTLFCLMIFIVGVQTAVAQTDIIDEATISGIITNGTTSGNVPEGSEVTLHAYNSSYTRAETFVATVSPNGRFQFSISNKPADWVYMVSITYQDLEYSSNIGSLSNSQTLNLPITVYEPTQDATEISIDRLHISLTAVGNDIQISELYTFNNDATAVFTGSSGNSDDGTIALNLPNGANNPTFERGLGSNGGYFPTIDFFQQDGRWYDTVALRPGPNSLILLVTYRLPAAEHLTLTRELPYQTNSIIVALPDNGTIFASDGWQQQSTQSAGENGIILSYARNDFQPGSSLSLAFAGADMLRGNGRSPINTSPSATDWIISLGILLFVTATAVRLLRRRANPAAAAQLAPVGSPSQIAIEAEPDERWQLLFSLANLDNAYKNGKLSKDEYQNQRQEMKTRLRTIWEIA
ncbi:MAG: hypothetical protein GY805_07785 [Chloroflexi bacterium]|nr:hypothetical protein [Chloroflexota bacterium]